MRRFLLFALVGLASTVALAKGPEQSQGFYDYSKGVDTYHSSLSLPDGFVQDSLNVLFDGAAPVEKRKGYTLSFSTKSYSYTGAWTYTDASNTSWIIVRSSDQLTASNLTGSVVKIATVSVNDLVGEVNAFSNAYFVDPTQGVYYWNGTSATFVSGSPHGSLITQFHGRVWVSGAAAPNGNQLYGSKYLDGTTWTTGSNPTDPVQLTVGLQDNYDNLTAIYTYLDTLYLFKHFSVYSLYGFDQSNFQISFLTQECGCIDQQSIQTYNHALIFVSLRGVESFDGYGCTRISDPVKNKVDAVSQNAFGTQSWVQASNADFLAGTSTPTGSLYYDSSLLGVTLSSSTGSFQDDLAADFNAGTLSSTTVSADSVHISTNNSGNINENSFESSGANWVPSGAIPFAVASSAGGFHCGTVSPRTGSGLAMASWGSGTGPTSVALTAQLLLASDLSEIAHITTSIGSPVCSWTPVTVTAPASAIGKRFKFRLIGVLNGVNESFYTSSSSFILGGNMSFYYTSDSNGSSYPSSGLNIAVDDILLGSSTISSGTFTSRVFNTSATLTSVTFNTLTTQNNFVIPTVLQTSTGSSGPWSDVTSTQNVAAAGSQYLRYLSTFTVGPNDNALSSLNQVNISWSSRRSSGTYLTQSHQISGTYTFGNFSTQETDNGGTIAYAICTSSMSTMAPKTCASLSANSQITVATNTYVQAIASFTITYATQTPVLQSETIQWFSGNRSPSMTSTVWDNRYWLSLSTNTAENFNDAVLVLNPTGAWSIFDLKAGGLLQYKNSLYHADSTATGNVYLDNQGYADNGTAIGAFIKTKDYSQGDLTQDHYLEAIYPSMDNLGNFNVGVSYFVDRSTTSYTLGTVSQSEFSTQSSVKLPIPYDASHQAFGQTVSYKFTASDLNEPWKFYGFRQISHTRPTQ